MTEEGKSYYYCLKCGNKSEYVSGLVFRFYEEGPWCSECGAEMYLGSSIAEAREGQERRRLQRER